MKIPRFNTIAILSLFALPFLSLEATAQMRPDCLADPAKPGACFLETDPEDGYVFCDDGLFLWAGLGSGENDFARVNPDGRTFVHYSDRDLFVGYCTWDVVAMGLCFYPSPEVFYGIADVQVNGWYFSSGISGCPFVFKSRGEVTRPSDGKTLWVAPNIVAVPDPDTVCKITECTILGTGNKNAEEDSD